MKGRYAALILVVVGVAGLGGRRALRASGGRFIPIGAPWCATGTSANGISPQGDIVGSYTDSNRVDHGFLPRRG